MSEEIKNTENTKSAKVQKAAKPANKKPNVFKRFASFCKETKSELKKVVWPSPKQVLNNTLVVIVVMLIFAVFVGAVDALFKFAIGLVF